MNIKEVKRELNASKLIGGEVLQDGSDLSTYYLVGIKIGAEKTGRFNLIDLSTGVIYSESDIQSSLEKGYLTFVDGIELQIIKN